MKARFKIQIHLGEPRQHQKCARKLTQKKSLSLSWPLHVWTRPLKHFPGMIHSPQGPRGTYMLWMALRHWGFQFKEQMPWLASENIKQHFPWEDLLITSLCPSVSRIFRLRPVTGGWPIWIIKGGSQESHMLNNCWLQTACFVGYVYCYLL